MAEKKNRIIPALPRGMRDHLPAQLKPRLEVIDRIRHVFELYGFLPLETPAMEKLDILTGKYGEEGDKLSYRVMKRGAEFQRALDEVTAGEGRPDDLADLGLRYDLTVPLARVVAQHGHQLPRPFKRYQIGPVWRADRPQQGRYREFIQCDVDIVGASSPLADAELIALTIDVFQELDIVDIEVRLNHRGLLAVMSETCGNPPDRFTQFCAALDKLDKIGFDGVRDEMERRGLAFKIFDQLRQLPNTKDYKPRRDFMQEFIGVDPVGRETLETIDKVYEFALNLGVREELIVFDPTLARGLDYYTGPVFEVISQGAEGGSLAGGGRYDELIGMFSKEAIPATGTSFGLERIIDLMLKRELITPAVGSAQICIVLIGDEPLTSPIIGSVLKFFHKNEISCDIGYEFNSKLGRQIQSAVKRGSQYVILIGADELAGFLNLQSPDEVEQAIVTVKQLSDGQQHSLSLEDVITWIKSGILPAQSADNADIPSESD